MRVSFSWTFLALILLFLSLTGPRHEGRLCPGGETAEPDRGKVFRDRVEPHWFDENRQFWYKVRTGPGTMSSSSSRRKRAGSGRPSITRNWPRPWPRRRSVTRPADRLPIEQLAFDPAGKYVDLQFGGRWWRCNLDTYELSPRPAAAHADDKFAANLATFRRRSAGQPAQPATIRP